MEPPIISHKLSRALTWSTLMIDASGWAPPVPTGGSDQVEGIFSLKPRLGARNVDPRKLYELEPRERNLLLF